MQKLKEYVNKYTLNKNEFAPLFAASRGPITENIYSGIAAISDNRKLIKQFGDSKTYFYLRSSAKPFQALPLIMSGAYKHYHLTDAEIAVITASHNGEPCHVKLVQNILKKSKISEKALQCGIGYPLNKKLEIQMRAKGNKPKPIQGNCSGNHAGMLATCKFLGYSLDSYLDIKHPIQQNILKILAELTELPQKEIAIGIDGCGMPTFALPVSKIALLFAKLINPDMSTAIGKALNKVANIMMNYPYLIAGEKRIDTVLMSAKKGIVSKAGAAGLYCVGIKKNGYGIALKLEAGINDMLPATQMAIGGLIFFEIMKQLKIFNKKEQRYLNKIFPQEIVSIHKKPVGKFLPLFKI